MSFLTLIVVMLFLNAEGNSLIIKTSYTQNDLFCIDIERQHKYPFLFINQEHIKYRNLLFKYVILIL